MDKNGGGLWLAVARRCNCLNWRTTGCCGHLTYEAGWLRIKYHFPFKRPIVWATLSWGEYSNTGGYAQAVHALFQQLDSKLPTQVS